VSVSTENFASLASAKYVSLRTFRKTGVAVDTAVWFAMSGDDLVVTTSRETGKVKRIRNTSTVELRECTMRGEVAEGAPVVLANAVVDDSDAARQELHAIMAKKYGFMYRMMTLKSPFSRPKEPTTVMLRLSPRS
jgi:PPOX class probable F420-dependent enzyme